MVRAAVDSGLLNGSQRRVYEKVVAHATARLNGNLLPPFLLNVDGTAGTVKSFLIDAISQRLESLQALAPSSNPLVRRLAPTGVAAFNISGQTYHSALGLRVDNKGAINAASNARLVSLQEDWVGTHYLIIDEKSMIGRAALGRIDNQLRQIFPTFAESHSADFSVMLVGDFGQLPPVGDRPFFLAKWDEESSARKALQNAGRLAYLAISESISLDVVMRQDGRDEETERFKDTLGRLRSGTPTRTDFDLLRTRFWHELSPAEQRSFDDCLTLSTVRESVAIATGPLLSKAPNPSYASPLETLVPAPTRPIKSRRRGWPLTFTS